jgi:hypothetical protein
MSDSSLSRLTRDEIEAEVGTPLPAKEVISLLDLNVNLDLALDLAAPIDLAVAANANIAAPIDAAVAANLLSLDSTATALADQGALIDQRISGEAIATAPQQVALDQSNDVVDDGSGTMVADDIPTAAPGTGAGELPDAGSGVPVGDLPDTGTGTPVGSDLPDPGTVVGNPTDVVNGALEGDLLHVNVDVALDADLAAPVAGAVAANANAAAPIDAAVAANVGSVGSAAAAVADQDAVITQDLDGVVAEATADQQAEIDQ